MAITASTPHSNTTKIKHWLWHTDSQIVKRNIKDARTLIATQKPIEINLALSLLDEALAISPCSDQALELRARSLLCLRRFKDVADMLQDYIPNLKMANDSGSDSCVADQNLFEGFPDLMKRVMTNLFRSGSNEGYWRYLVLGEACFHLGLLDHATILLQTGKSLARTAFRCRSSSWSDDRFSECNISFSDGTISRPPTTKPYRSPISRPPTTNPSRSTQTKYETINQLLAKTKLHLSHRTTAITAFEAGFYTEAIRHLSKIIDSFGTPQAFLAECYMLRALAYRSASRIADSIADCNRTLSLDPKCFNALEARASILESIHCYHDCIHDLERLKLLYNMILHDHELFDSVWKPCNIRYDEIPKKISTITTRIEQLEQKKDNAEIFNVDYYTLMGLPHGCDQSELERAYLLLDLRHNPEIATCFIERCELDENQNIQLIKDRARMFADLLYKLIEKGHSSVRNTIMEEESYDKFLNCNKQV